MDYIRTSEIFKALGHPTRLKIIELVLSNKSLCVCNIYEALDLEQANVSQHLRVLKNAGLLNSKKEGLNVHYSICCDAISEVLEKVLAIEFKNKGG